MNIKITPDMKIVIDDNPVIFSDGIRAIRKYKGWKREDLGYYLKVSPRTVEGWELGRSPAKTTLALLQHLISV